MDYLSVIPDAAHDSEDAGTFTFNDVTIDIDALPDLTGRPLPELNQATYRKGIYNNGCTWINRVKEFCYIFLADITAENSENIEKAAQQAVKDGWNPSGGRQTRQGFTAAAKAWNIANPDDIIVRGVTTRGDNMLTKLIEQGYPVGVTKILSKEYLDDAQMDGIVSLKNTAERTTGHSSTFLKNQDYLNFKKIQGATSDIMIRNDFYGSLKYNGYVIEYIDDLVKNGVYYPGMYRMIPQKFITQQIADIKDKKRQEIEAKYGSTPGDVLLKLKELYAEASELQDQDIMKFCTDGGVLLRKKFPSLQSIK